MVFSNFFEFVPWFIHRISFKTFTQENKKKLVWKLSVREKWKNGKQAKNIMAAKV